MVLPPHTDVRLHESDPLDWEQVGISQEGAACMWARLLREPSLHPATPLTAPIAHHQSNHVVSRGQKHVWGRQMDLFKYCCFNSHSCCWWVCWGKGGQGFREQKPLVLQQSLLLCWRDYQLQYIARGNRGILPAVEITSDSRRYIIRLEMK